MMRSRVLLLTVAGATLLVAGCGLQAGLIFNQPPVAAFSWRPGSCAVNVQGQGILATGRLCFDAGQSFDADGRIVRYEWTLAADVNGTAVMIGRRQGQRASFNFLVRQPYTITLTVTDNQGAVDKKAEKIRL